MLLEDADVRSDQRDVNSHETKNQKKGREREDVGYAQRTGERREEEEGKKGRRDEKNNKNKGRKERI